MTIARKWILVAVVGGSLIGGAIGGGVFSAASGSAASNNSSSSAAPSGSFKPIETASHEANESKAREAQEDAGQVPTVP